MVREVLQNARQMPLIARHGKNHPVALLQQIHHRLDGLVMGAGPRAFAKAAAAPCTEGKAKLGELYLPEQNGRVQGLQHLLGLFCEQPGVSLAGSAVDDQDFHGALTPPR